MVLWYFSEIWITVVDIQVYHEETLVLSDASISAL